MKNLAESSHTSALLYLNTVAQNLKAVTANSLICLSRLACNQSLYYNTVRHQQLDSNGRSILLATTLDNVLKSPIDTTVL